MNEIIWIALALMLVFEGLLPAINPQIYRQLVQLLSERDEKTIRIIGISMMVLGAIIIYIVKH
ncbi:MAG: DUF2065 domain-containing protein [Thioalkalispiraceae bacterium]|jgi:uncharacterized protein YjeT (DUF2065 family)